MGKVRTILSEKPSQALAYSSAFKGTSKKDGYIEVNDSNYFDGKTFITWGFGHLVSLCPPGFYDSKWEKWDLGNLPIMPEKFAYEVPSDKKSQFKKVKELLLMSDEVIIATDCDREGELIAACIIEQAGASHIPAKRLWINSLEVEDVQNGFKNLHDAKEHTGKALEAQARQFGDWLVGMNASPLYSLNLRKKGISEVFSVGRIQSPTLYMIYEREMEIRNFVSKPFFELYAKIKVANGEFITKYSGRFDKKEEIQQLLQKHAISNQENTSISKLTKELKETKSPRLHSLSTLQTKANKKWKYSPADVLKTTQSLYERHKILSYPRTDTNYITESEFKYLKANFEEYKKVANADIDLAFPEPQKRYIDGSKCQEHYAIIPTKKIPNSDVIAQLNEKEKNIYFEVLSTTLAMFAPTYKYEETLVEVDIKNLLFKASGKVEKEKGWKVLFSNEQSEEKKEDNSKLPIMEEGENAVANPQIKEGKTQPPKPLTEGMLLNLMKTAGKSVEDEELQAILKDVSGLGTEATRANCIETLKTQSYIVVKKNIVQITKKGEILCQAIEGTLLSKPEMTAQWEKYLRCIGEGTKTQSGFLKNIERFINLIMEEAPKHIESSNITQTIAAAKEEEYISSCPVCKTGKFTDKGKFYGCNNYSEGCKASLPKQFAGKNLSENMVKLLLEKGKTNKLKGFKKKDKSGTFDAPLRVDINKESKNLKIGFDFAKK
ncbi:DNA topoisomerase III [Priestia megaterium]|uniref:type IA DNA topoisomerase n=1 Tax=Priestia megaterium TaxID=1404 RepID=UPI0035DA2705